MPHGRPGHAAAGRRGSHVARLDQRARAGGPFPGPAHPAVGRAGQGQGHARVAGGEAPHGGTAGIGRARHAVQAGQLGLGGHQPVPGVQRRGGHARAPLPP
eukprot:6555265-Lingulodinium_polyedra.AAC.1